MRYKTLALIIILALFGSLLALSSFAATSWTGAGLSGESVYGLATSSSGAMYAATPDAIYKKIGSASWEPLSGIDKPAGTNFFAVAVSSDGKAVYATSWGWTKGEFYSSADGDANWSKVADIGFQALAVSGSTIYGATSSVAGDPDGQIYKSTDGGANWTKASVVESSGDVTYVTSLAAVGNTVYAGTDSGVYRSTNSGANWSQLSGSTSLAGPLYVTAADGTVFAATEGAGIYRLAGDSSWKPVADGSNAIVSSLAVSAAYATDKTVYAGTDGAGIFSSKVEGSSGTTPPGNQDGGNGGTGGSPGTGTGTSAASGTTSTSATTATTVLGTVIFSDIPANAWYKGYVSDMHSKKVINGYPNGEFRPLNPVTRAEFAKMLCLVRGWALLSPASPSFGDCPKGSWAFRFVETAKASKAISGYKDGDFRPNNNITRAEIAKMLARSLSLKSGETALTDIESHWAKDYISACAKAGIVSGYPGGIYRPDHAVTRAEAAKMLYRALK